MAIVAGTKVITVLVTAPPMKTQHSTKTQRNFESVPMLVHGHRHRLECGTIVSGETTRFTSVEVENTFDYVSCVVSEPSNCCDWLDIDNGPILDGL